jgi:hypothetical protein
MYCFISDINPTPASTDTDPHPEYMISKIPDSIEEDDISLKVKVSVCQGHYQNIEKF